jgi:hypothetical protein
MVRKRDAAGKPGNGPQTQTLAAAQAAALLAILRRRGESGLRLDGTGYSILRREHGLTRPAVERAAEHLAASGQARVRSAGMYVVLYAATGEAGE